MDDDEALLMARVFEQAPHVALVLTPGLEIRAANAAARAFLGRDAAQLHGQPLFDVLPAAKGGNDTWHDRLRASYLEMQAGADAARLLLPPHEGVVDETVLPSIWHVCHAPVRDASGCMVAIATTAHALAGAEIVIAQVSGYATAQRAAAAPASVPTNAPAMLKSQHLDGVIAADTGNTEPPGRRDALHILLVEDSDDLRGATAEHLQFLGHKVTAVADAEQAMRQLETGRFDLLFTDLTLPKMTGAELARLVLQTEQAMQVVITSGYGRALANAQNLDALFLPKPYGNADLQEIVRQVLERLGRTPV